MRPIKLKIGRLFALLAAFALLVAACGSDGDGTAVSTTTPSTSESTSDAPSTTTGSSTTSSSTFTEDQRVIELLDNLATVITARGNLNQVASARGLYVSHHADPVRFSPDELVTVLVDDTRYKWPSNALDVNDPDQAQEIPAQTFAVAIGDSFVSAWNDSDRVVAWDEPLTGGNGRLPSHAIPPELSGFHYLSVHDPGDNPAYDGLDWISWHVSIDYEDGTPVVVGLTFDQWAP